MRRTWDILVATSFIALVFWPWCLGIVEAVRWFFHLSYLLSWDEQRVAMAVFWPGPALLVLVFLGWLYGEVFAS